MYRAVIIGDKKRVLFRSLELSIFSFSSSEVETLDLGFFWNCRSMGAKAYFYIIIAIIIIIIIIIIINRMIDLCD